MRIVGIGASAGGLLALEQFIAHVPPNAGLAFVVVQHLDPFHKAILADLLQRVTSLRVCEAGDQMPIERDCVYVIPPNTELSVRQGVLQLEKPSEPRGMRLPINVLFSSLARDQGASAIGVVLSGMGADGTQGLQAIKAVGGLTLVQQPESAQFDAMPLSAIHAGCADIIALPQDMPARIMACTSAEACESMPDAPQDTAQPAEAPATEGPYDDATTGGPATAPMAAIFTLLQERTRHDFSLYKSSTLRRRIDRRMAIHGLRNMNSYVDLLRQSSQEIDLLFKELLIGVTGFFRDPAAWQALRDKALPALFAQRTAGAKLRAWVVGCSTGEEAYTLAMSFIEALDKLPRGHGHHLQIFASDLSTDAINTARASVYPTAIDESVSPERLARFFTARDSGWRINKDIRDMVLFAQHDVVLDPPFSKLDILCCRNLLIYFDAALQRRLMPLFHYTLRADGILLLGSSETVGTFNQLFAPIDSALRLYVRRGHTANAGPSLMLKSFPPLSSLPQEPAVSPPLSMAFNADSLQTAADHVLLQVHAPPAVVVNSEGDIVYISGRTGKYLEPAAGKANWNFHAMVHDSLRNPISNAIAKALAQNETVHCRGLQASDARSSSSAQVDITVQPLREPAALKGMVMIVFRDVALQHGPGKRRKPDAMDAAHAAEVQQCRDEIQALREEARTSKEELQSANEELQSINEELQSANEELTTSKEEMQSMNEELQTVNAEMQTKLDDLALAQSDLKNLLNSTDIAMLFLDQNLNVRRYTERATKIINLRENDIGRPLTDLTTSLHYPTLQEDTQETLRTLVFSEKQIETSDERWFSVRIMPYRRLDNVIDGAVITFVDITATKALENKLRQSSKAHP